MIRIGITFFCASFMLQLAVIAHSVGFSENMHNGIECSSTHKNESVLSSKLTEKIIQGDSIHFTYPMGTTIVKRKSPISIRWKGGQPGTTYFLELFNNGIYQQQIAEIVDQNQYEWQVTKDLDGGKNYQFRLVNSRFFGDYSFSPKFQVKNRIPRAFWAVPAAVGAAGIYFLIKLIAESGPGPEDKDLPAPIEPY